MVNDSTEADDLGRLAAAGDGGAWGAMLTQHQERLCRMVAFRLDHRLRGRVDPSDVVQDAFVQASAHRDNYFNVPSMPLFLWLRGIVGNKLLEIHRHHLGTRMRDAAREVGRPAGCGGTSEAMAYQLSGGGTGPATAAARAEVSIRVSEALEQLGSIDREVLALRHFEQLSNGEAAAVLGIQERAAAKRYLRALERLKDLLVDMPGGLTGLRP